MDNGTTGTIAMSELQLLMARALCRQALRGVADNDDLCDLEAVFVSMTDGQREIAATAFGAIVRAIRTGAGPALPAGTSSPSERNGVERGVDDYRHDKSQSLYGSLGGVIQRPNARIHPLQLLLPPLLLLAPQLGQLLFRRFPRQELLAPHAECAVPTDASVLTAGTSIDLRHLDVISGHGLLGSKYSRGGGERKAASGHTQSFGGQRNRSASPSDTPASQLPAEPWAP